MKFSFKESVSILIYGQKVNKTKRFRFGVIAVKRLVELILYNINKTNKTYIATIIYRISYKVMDYFLQISRKIV